jgi:hypothetical protein
MHTGRQGGEANTFFLCGARAFSLFLYHQKLLGGKRNGGAKKEEGHFSLNIQSFKLFLISKVLSGMDF